MTASGDLKTQPVSLAERLRARIRREGPISFHDWMESALYDRAEGYYCRPDRMRWGREGDYRTAPETSPLFAATFARYFARIYLELGSPSQWTIVEAGAGSGEFARGVLTSLESQHPQVFAATRYLIDEISADAREQIHQVLLQFHDQVKFQTLAEIEDRITGIIFANELLDAFPTHRVIVRDGRLRELCVGLSDEEEFAWVECELTNQRLAEYLACVDVRLSEGQIVDVSLAAENWIARASEALEQGFIISVDYGAERDALLSAPHRRKGTLRAFRRHQLANNLLARPGEQDLTTTIDWTQIKEAGKQAGLETLRFQTLDQFLLNEGLLDELESIARGQDNAGALRLRTSAREMIMPNGMASAFQVLIQRKHSTPG
jgi:SAM-dependent MidA family methyltransferase